MLKKIINAILEQPSNTRNIVRIPNDTRTCIKKAKLEVALTKTLCCRVCFLLYEEDRNSPILCEYRHFPNFDPCNEQLYVQKPVYKGYSDLAEFEHYPSPSTASPNVVGVPQCMYVYQTIETWLRWILSRSDTESEIVNWAAEIRSQHDLGYHSDIQHGQNYREIQWENSPNSLQLGLALFVDWFNPRGKKLSGKTESTGIIALSCINLSPTLRNKISHMCLVGITPGPYSPDPQTLNHLLNPLVKELHQLEQGLVIPTYQFPNGRNVEVKLVAVQGDTLATKKVAGFASHSATCFCSFCHARSSDLSSMSLSKKRTKCETLSAAKALRDAANASIQDKILRETGVQWSALNELLYWDPAKHVALGVMHNWLEGILQSHFRYRWKFWAIPPYEAKKKRKTNQTTHATKRRNIDSNTEMCLYQESSGGDDTSVEEDILVDGGLDGGFFSQEDILHFCVSMSNIVLPPGLPHLPPNLGESKHGKLSAKQWHALFVYIIPLVIFEMYVDNVASMNIESNRSQVLLNTSQLVHCTNIVFAQYFKPADVKRFEKHYQNYSDKVGTLFRSVKFQPNHHFALHILEQMQAWSPLRGVAEFGGERLIGFLQKLRTNNKIGEPVPSCSYPTYTHFVFCRFDESNHDESRVSITAVDGPPGVY